MTNVSGRYLELARELAERCPDELGVDIAVTGSVARGFADEASDIELNFWVESPVEQSTIQEWLKSAGVERTWPDPSGDTETTWLAFERHGTWFEAGWQTLARAEEVLGEILGLRRLGGGELMLADVIANALPLRSGGKLAGWKARLQPYPDDLARALIERELAFWGYPQWVDARWAAARRGHWITLTRELRADVSACLRVVFAVNRQWEPDWKWLNELTASLSIQPPDLVDRVNAVFANPSPEERVEVAYRLILDTLDLVPPSNRVEEAREVVTQSLATRGQP